MYWPNLKSVAFPVPEIIGGTPKMGTPWIRPRSLFSKIFNGHLLGWTLWMYWQNLKSVAFPVPEIIGGTQKIWAVPGYAHAPFFPKWPRDAPYVWVPWKFVGRPWLRPWLLFPKFLMGFRSDWAYKCACKIEVRSFTRSWDNRGTRKIGQSLDTPRLPFL